RLQSDVHEVSSERRKQTVVAQDPAADATVTQRSAVRLEVSKGARPIAVPPVVGQSFESASGELTSAGFAVARKDVDSTQLQGIVVGQSPGPNSLQPRGSTITLSVSKGPKLSTVPDVTGLDQDS